MPRAAKPSAPMTDQDLDELNKLIKSCTESADYFKTCEECGIDVRKEAEVNREQLDMATKIKSKWFPHAK